MIDLSECIVIDYGKLSQPIDNGKEKVILFFTYQVIPTI